MRFEAVMFDLGSTLMYFDGDFQEIMPHALEALHKFLQSAGYDLGGNFTGEFQSRMESYYLERETEFIEHTTRAILKGLLDEWGYLEVPDSNIIDALAAFHAVTQSCWQPSEDTLPVLTALRVRGFKLGMISNAADDADVQRLIDKAGIRDCFDVILTSAAEGIRKPNPLIFIKALDAINVAPSRAMMVGDTLGADILGARNAGIFSVWLTRWADTPANRAHADTIKPDASIRMLAEIFYLLE